MSQGTKQQAVRLPVELHAKIVAAATENNRSGHAEMLYRLAASFRDPNQIVIDVVRGDLNALEERLLEKLAPEVFVNSFSIDASSMSKEDIDKMRAELKSAGMYAELSVLHGSATGRLSESQPEISGLNTLPQAMRKRGCMCGGGVAGFHNGGFTSGTSEYRPGEVPAILSQGVNSMERLPLEGQTWVITGSLETMSRDSAREKLMRLGARVSGSVDYFTNALLHGPGAGSKKDKAVRIGVPLWEEAEFVKLVDSYQHLTVPGALEWDHPNDGWTENTGSMPVQPTTRVLWRVRGGFGNTSEDVQGPEPASTIDWTLGDEPDAFDIMFWRLA